MLRYFLGNSPFTLMPILRAVPATIRMAASTVKQFRSGILSLAIASICSHVTSPIQGSQYHGLRGTALDLRGFFELDGYGRLFNNKVERLIAINRDDDWKDLPRLVLGTCIELFTEVHDIDSLGTQRRTHWG